MDGSNPVAGRTLAAVLLALVLAATLAGMNARGAAAQSGTVQVTCTFSNPAYAGSCVETTTRTEKQKPSAACRPILDCLNNPNCAKSYCQATTVRQGWTLKSAE